MLDNPVLLLLHTHKWPSAPPRTEKEPYMSRMNVLFRCLLGGLSLCWVSVGGATARLKKPFDAWWDTQWVRQLFLSAVCFCSSNASKHDFAQEVLHKAHFSEPSRTPIARACGVLLPVSCAGGRDKGCHSQPTTNWLNNASLMLCYSVPL